MLYSFCGWSVVSQLGKFAECVVVVLFKFAAKCKRSRDMIPAIIGAVVGAAGTGANALLGAAERRRQQRILDAEERKNRLWYDRRYNEVGRETAVGQRMLEKMREAQRERMSSVAGRSAVMGGSSAVSAAESAAANKAIGDTVGAIDAQQEARRDRIEQQYRQRDAQISAQRQNMSAQQQANLANAATQASAIGAQVAMSAAGNGGKSKVKSSENDTLSENTKKVMFQSPSEVAKVEKIADPYGYREDYYKQIYGNVWQD